MNPLRLLRPLAVVLTLSGSDTIYSQAPNPAPAKEPPTLTIKMNDQFDRAQDLKNFKGDVVVLIYGDRKAGDANAALGERLHVQFHPTAKGLPVDKARKAPPAPLENLPQGVRSPDVHVLPVACIGKVPGVVKTMLRGQFEKASPVIPVWMDFEDTMRTSFGLNAGTPNLIVIDAQNRLRFKLQGEMTDKHYERLVQVIDYLRKEAVSK